MRLSLITFLIFISMTSFSQNEFNIHINDTIFGISLDKDYNISLNGKEIKLRLSAKDTLVYEDDLFSFKYTKDYKISHVKVEEGIEQIVLMTAEGTGMLIQKYSIMNPKWLNEMMISELTKESLNYGYEMNRNDFTRELISGQEIEVNKVILTYKGDTQIYEVASIGKKDEGILIVTVIMNEGFSEQGRKIIEMMWNSLIFK